MAPPPKKKAKLMGLQSKDFRNYYREQDEIEDAERTKEIYAEEDTKRKKKAAIANTRDPKKVAQMERRRTMDPHSVNARPHAAPPVKLEIFVMHEQKRKK